MGVLGDVCCAFGKAFHTKCVKCRDMYDFARNVLARIRLKCIENESMDETYEKTLAGIRPKVDKRVRVDEANKTTFACIRPYDKKGQIRMHIINGLRWRFLR